MREKTQMVLDYVSGVSSADEIAEEINKNAEDVNHILMEAKKAWDNVEVDPDGPNVEEDKELDQVLIDYAQELTEL